MWAFLSMNSLNCDNKAGTESVTIVEASKHVHARFTIWIKRQWLWCHLCTTCILKITFPIHKMYRPIFTLANKTHELNETKLLLEIKATSKPMT